MSSDDADISRLINGMRKAYANGENAMEYARSMQGEHANTPISALIAYDLQAGSYIDDARRDPGWRRIWCEQLSLILGPYVTENSSILEVGCGEATTLSGVLDHLRPINCNAYGFDISWSRCAYGRTWLAEKEVAADLFVADLFNIPLDDSSIDVVYTSHSLEPNGGREQAAIAELMRVARKAVVMIEPVFELANTEAQKRMIKHGYVRNLKQTAEGLGALVCEYRLLEHSGNPLNPSGLVLLDANTGLAKTEDDYSVKWRCPLTHTSLVSKYETYFSPETGLAYPVFGGIPLLHKSHAVVASAFEILGSSGRG